MSSKVIDRTAASTAVRMAWDPADLLGHSDDAAEARALFAAAPSPQGRTQPNAEHAAELEAEFQARARAEREAGFREGQAAGLEAARAQLEPVVHQLGRTIAELAALRSRFRAEAERDVVHLALAIARKVLHRESSIDPDALLGLVKAALAKLDAREVHKVRLNPQDAAMLRRHLDQIGLPKGVEIEGDFSMPPGSALFDTLNGTMDAGVESQLAEIERGFADLLRGR